MKRKLTANILIYAIILMMIPIHTLAEPEITPLPPEQIQNNTIQPALTPVETSAPAPELETQDPNISYAVSGEAPPVDYSMLDNYNNNYNCQYGQEPEEDIGLQNEGDVGVEDNTPSVNESGTENFEPTTFDSPYNQINNQNENITLNQGSLNISNTILSLPGKNGLDLTLNLSYNSGSAVLDSPLYYYPGSPGFNNYFRVATQNCFFAPGWELSKSYIEMYNMEDLYKPGTRAMTLHLADGRTYQIQNNGFGPEYEIYGCNTGECG